VWHATAVSSARSRKSHAAWLQEQQERPQGCVRPGAGLLLNNLGVQRGCLLMFDSMEPAHCDPDPDAEAPAVLVRPLAPHGRFL